MVAASYASFSACLLTQGLKMIENININILRYLKTKTTGFMDQSSLLSTLPL